MSSTRAAVHSTNLSPSPAETQDQMGLIKQEIRSLQEQLPLLDVEENVGTLLDNATSVLEKYREPIISVDWLRWVRGCCILWLPCLERLTLFILQLLELRLAQWWGCGWMVARDLPGSHPFPFFARVPGGFFLPEMAANAMLGTAQGARSCCLTPDPPLSPGGAFVSSCAAWCCWWFSAMSSGCCWGPWG